MNIVKNADGSRSVSFVIAAGFEERWFRAYYDWTIASVEDTATADHRARFDAAYRELCIADGLANVALTIDRKIEIRDQAKAAAAATFGTPRSTTK